MKKVHRIAILGIGFLFMLLFDVAPQLMPESHAVLGVRRRTARRTAVVVGSASAANSAQAQQQAAPPPAEPAPAPAAPAPAPAAAPAAPAPAAAPAPGAVPLGTIVNQLPENCPPTTINNVQYYSCGGNYYRAAFQGSQLVYITTQP